MVKLTFSLRSFIRAKPEAQSSLRIFRALLPVYNLFRLQARIALRVVALAVACALWCVPSLASLHVRDDARHAEQWFRLYDELPDVWKTRRVIRLRELSPRDMERLIAKVGGDEADRHDDSIVDGCYQSGEDDEDTPLISVCDNLRGEQAGLVFTHEYGHYVWDAMLTSTERARYTRVWRTQKRSHHLVTEYAGDSDEEGFAEAFAYFLRKPALLQKRDPASVQFFHDWLGNR